MNLQSELFLHISHGPAGDAAPLMARIVLNLGYDSMRHPVDLAEVLRVCHFKRDARLCGMSEMFVLEYIRAVVMGSARTWDDFELNALKRIAAQPQRPAAEFAKGLSLPCGDARPQTALLTPAADR